MTKERGREWEEYDNAVRWMATTFLISIVVSIAMIYLSQPIAFLVHKGVSKENVEIAMKFLKKSIIDPGFLYDRYMRWFHKALRYNGEFRVSFWLPILPFILFPVILAVGGIKCPYKFQSNVHGAAHIATLRDIERMPLLGFDGFCMVVGKFHGRMLKLKETLSTLCCAPPGTGKTAGVVIPTIFNSDGMSIIVNDPKPELCFSTTGARNKVGPVFVINWGKEDNPETGEYTGDNSKSPSGRTITEEQFQHRMILRRAMLAHGFKPLDSEWWHFTLRDEPFPDTYFTFPVKQLK
jgi:type IV secretory pathway TraG/TraD family ATPase VirD4